MNEVYIINEVEDYEGSRIVGVFSTEAAAKNKVLTYKLHTDLFYYTIDNWTINSGLKQRSFYINGNWVDTNWPFNYPK